MRKTCAVLTGMALLGAINANAAIDASLTGASTDISGYFDTIKLVVVAIVVFFVGVKLAKRIVK